MKKLSALWVITVIAMLPSFAFAADLTAEQVRKGIVGEWQLLSFESGGKVKEDYSADKVIWRFAADATASISDKRLGEFTDGYRVVKSSFGWIGKGGVLILIKELKKRGFSHPKFMVRRLTAEGDLLLGDWDDTFIYRLRRVQ
ncbi:MAG: hypothetical protein Q8P24_12730 [Desulfobacterales bacterium]|nr:hypothetical protein [Desulfobacterales bacterium]